MDTKRLALAVAGLWWAAALTAHLAAAEAARTPEASFIITSWGTEDGLPRNTVPAITQTRDGYLWLGTLNGLVRFDGIRFTVFDEVNTPGLASSGIASLFEDSQGRLWINLVM